MRKLLIAGILAAAVAAVVVMSSMRPEPPRQERVELDPLVEVMTLEDGFARMRALRAWVSGRPAGREATDKPVA